MMSIDFCVEASHSLLTSSHCSGQNISKFSEIDCTAHYKAFKYQLYSYKVVGGTLAMLLHQKDKVINALLEHLVIPDSMATKTLLDLGVMLARDLREDFFQYFPKFLEVIVTLLDTRPEDVELVESAFSALCFFFKFLRKQLLADMPAVLR